MDWTRTTRGRLTCNLGAYRGIVERTPDDATWLARVEAPEQAYTSVFEYRTMAEARAWVEQKIEALLRAPPRRSS